MSIMQAQRVTVSMKPSDALFLVDGEQNIVAWSEGATRLLGYSEGEVLGKPCYEVVAGVDERGYRVCSRSCPVFCPLGSSRLNAMITQCRAKDGHVVWLASSHLDTIAENGEHAGVLHVIQDVTPGQKAMLLVRRVAAELDKGISNGYANPQQEEEKPFELSPRETQVLRLLHEGRSTAAIANELVLSVFTVRNHVRNLLNKLSVETRVEALAVARRWNLV